MQSSRFVFRVYEPSRVRRWQAGDRTPRCSSLWSCSPTTPAPMGAQTATDELSPHALSSLFVLCCVAPPPSFQRGGAPGRPVRQREGVSRGVQRQVRNRQVQTPVQRARGQCAGSLAGTEGCARCSTWSGRSGAHRMNSFPPDRQRSRVFMNRQIAPPDPRPPLFWPFCSLGRPLFWTRVSRCAFRAAIVRPDAGGHQDRQREGESCGLRCAAPRPHPRGLWLRGWRAGGSYSRLCVCLFANCPRTLAIARLSDLCPFSRCPRPSSAPFLRLTVRPDPRQPG